MTLHDKQSTLLHPLPSPTLFRPPNTNSTKLILQATVHFQIELKHLSTFSLGKNQTCFQGVESLSHSELCCLQCTTGFLRQD